MSVSAKWMRRRSQFLMGPPGWPKVSIVSEKIAPAPEFPAGAGIPGPEGCLVRAWRPLLGTDGQDDGDAACGCGSGDPGHAGPSRRGQGAGIPGTGNGLPERPFRPVSGKSRHRANSRHRFHVPGIPVPGAGARYPSGAWPRRREGARWTFPATLGLIRVLSIISAHASDLKIRPLTKEGF